jgi:hypothetical protein
LEFFQQAGVAGSKKCRRRLQPANFELLKFARCKLNARKVSFFFRFPFVSRFFAVGMFVAKTVLQVWFAVR